MIECKTFAGAELPRIGVDLDDSVVETFEPLLQWLQEQPHLKGVPLRNIFSIEYPDPKLDLALFLNRRV